MAVLANFRLLIVEIPAAVLLMMQYAMMSRSTTGVWLMTRVGIAILAAVLCLHVAILMYLADWDPKADPDYDFWAQSDVSSGQRYRGRAIVWLFGLVAVGLYRLGPLINSGIWLILSGWFTYRAFRLGRLH